MNIAIINALKLPSYLMNFFRHYYASAKSIEHLKRGFLSFKTSLIPEHYKLDLNKYGKSNLYLNR
jgi:phosphopantetheinyl transferase